jgi:LacI family transcriptional regulator
MKIPLVFFDRVAADLDFPVVVFDDFTGAVTALDRVIEAGFSKIACFSGYQSISIGRERFNGYIESLKKHKIEIRKDWIIEGGYELKDGHSSFMKLKEHRDLPEIVFAVNDRVALGAYMAATESGIKIPDDIGIMGFGFSETTDFFNPPLAVIDQDPRKMGRLSAQKLMDGIIHGKTTSPVILKIEEEFSWKASLKKRIIK